MNCKNCNKPLLDSQKYCDECGAKVIKNRLTPKVLAAQVNEQFLSIDNKFLQTFITLLTKPHDVIDGYIKGTRKKYVGVITYYAISLTILGFQMFVLKNFFPDFLESQSTIFNESFKMSGNGNKNPFENFPDIFNNYQGIIFSVFMPFIAVGTWLVYIDKRKYNYTEHLVINLYLTAQTIYFSFFIFLLMAVFSIKDYMFATIIITLPLLLYGAYVFKKLYNSKFINAFIKYCTAYIIYMIVFSIIMFIITVVIVIYLISTGKFNP
ncbi:MAG: DUF3667 domain-containing protein [Winogradskyella sp.]|jgi:hypothetical protein